MNSPVFGENLWSVQKLKALLRGWLVFPHYGAPRWQGRVHGRNPLRCWNDFRFLSSAAKQCRSWYKEEWGVLCRGLAGHRSRTICLMHWRSGFQRAERHAVDFSFMPWHTHTYIPSPTFGRYVLNQSAVWLFSVAQWHSSTGGESGPDWNGVSHVWSVCHWAWRDGAGGSIAFFGPADKRHKETVAKKVSPQRIAFWSRNIHHGVETVSTLHNNAQFLYFISST